MLNECAEYYLSTNYLRLVILGRDSACRVSGRHGNRTAGALPVVTTSLFTFSPFQIGMASVALTSAAVFADVPPLPLSNDRLQSRGAHGASAAHDDPPLHAAAHGTGLAFEVTGPMNPEPQEQKKELYAMPLHEVIAILKSSAGDRAAAAASRRPRRRILAEKAPEPDLVVVP